ncbi:uncharacterized protein LOC114302362 [Camellia sinensis]|uniref:uncharacterized protein LOC114302362 n=1 Tax=Camellia sinensis TaxID=4442 RepID=UPI001036977B|nr:uncharacterized protein LOC114302362 [Camellia sinensis]
MSRPRPPSEALVSSVQHIVPPPLELVTQYHPIEMFNRYQVLGNIPKPSYTSALATDHFASSSQAVTPYPPNLIKIARSDYVKSTTTNLFFKEPSHPKSQSVNDLVKSYFPPGWHFVPMHPAKTITFYRDILFNHQSIVIKPIYDRTYTSKVVYHSLYIHNIVSLAEWGPPSQLRELPNNSLQYSYYDYIDAWIHTVKWWDNYKIPRIAELVQTEFPVNIHAPTLAMVKARQNPTASNSPRSPLPTVNLGSPTSSSSKPKSSKLKAKSKDKSSSAKPSSAQPQSKDKAKPISAKAKSKIKSSTPVSPAKPKVNSKSSRDELLEMARVLVEQANAQSDPDNSTNSDNSEEGSDSSHSSEGSDSSHSSEGSDSSHSSEGSTTGSTT